MTEESRISNKEESTELSHGRAAKQPGVSRARESKTPKNIVKNTKIKKEKK
jgi:hypothetical protein